MSKPIPPSEGENVAALLSAAAARHQSGDLAAAGAQYSKILQLAPDHPEALYLAGGLDHQLGAPEAAIAKLERSLAVRPDYLPAIEMLGAAALKAGRLVQAVQCFDAAAARKPTSPEAQHNLGMAHFHNGANDMAARALARAVELKPSYTDARYLLAAALRAAGRLEEAGAHYAALLSLQPAHARALDEYGGVLISLGRAAEAEAALRRAIGAAPDMASAYMNLGRLFQSERARAPEAVALHDQALMRNPNLADAHNNRGVALTTLGRFDEALASFRKAIALKPTLAEAHNNLGNALFRLGDGPGAASAFDKAISLKPDYAEAHWNKAYALLTRGAWAEAWAEYEWRWRCKEFLFPPRGFSQPAWHGEDLGGDALLLWGEQGLGEEILCAGMGADLVTRGANLIWECDARLVALLRRSFPGVRAVARATPPDPITRQAKAQVSTASLGQYLRRKASDFPQTRGPFLKADAERAAALRARALGPDGKRLIGISWVSKNPDFGVHKTSSLAAFAPLWEAAGPHARFIDVQYGDTAAERAAAGLPLQYFDDLDLFNDVDAAAALIAACDLVITVSNTTAHLAGALGVPVWVMTPSGSGKLWYWGDSDGPTPWYPAARVFKQRLPGDWGGVLALIADLLRGGTSTADTAPLLARAVDHHRAGRLQEAQQLYEEILAAVPGHFDALHLLGVVHLQAGRAGEAVRLIAEALDVNAASAAALANHGHALRSLGRFDEALASYDRALVIVPESDEAWKNRGDALQAVGRHGEAVAAYIAAVRLNPASPETHVNHGASLQALGRYAEALASFDKALALKPQHVGALSNRGDSLRKLNRPAEAGESYRRALTLDPTLTDTHAKYANALRDEGKYDEAIASYDRALALRPDHADVHVNRAAVLHELGDSAGALAGFARALAIAPDNAEAHWNRALVLLMQGKWQEGWADYEWRWKCAAFPSPARAFPQPRWDGRALAGKLLVWGEQGVGDEILYGTMVGDLVAGGIDVVWEADARLLPLIERSFPSVRAVARANPPDAAARDPGVGAQVPAASLGQYLRASDEKFQAAPRATLIADEARAAAYRAQLVRGGKKRVLGVSWVSKNEGFGADKSSRLSDWGPIWRAAGADAVFVDLQYGDTGAERAAAGLPLVHLDGLDSFSEIDGLAALIRACDQVITVSNTTAHLAGALGVPVKVMISRGAGKLWYWGHGRTSPWYPSATLYRQSDARVWTDTIQAIAADLKDQ